MSTIAEICIPTDEFVLRETLDAVPDAEFEVMRVAAHGTDDVIPFLTAHAPDQDDLERALTDDGSVENVTRLADSDDEWLYQMEWVEDIRFILHVLTEEDGTILSAYGNGDGWHLRILFTDRESLSATFDFCDQQGLSLDIKRIYELEDATRRGQYGLTAEQLDTLETAYERGFYDIPREEPMNALADELGISHQALSERLRRGHRNLIENTLVIGAADGPTER
ncbi:helix-turn-helix domain-containing protein [Natronoarchaeum mannanilyticum]|uniref:DNA-binding protein n=1 Tax=Natronoarchaeum mannanilyticum TaxID=926360 RepID=A0AAV3T542_9EURY